MLPSLLLSREVHLTLLIHLKLSDVRLTQSHDISWEVKHCLMLDPIFSFLLTRVFGLAVSYCISADLFFILIHFGRNGLTGKGNHLRKKREDNLRPRFVRSRRPNTIRNKGQHYDTCIVWQNNQQLKQNRTLVICARISRVTSPSQDKTGLCSRLYKQDR